MPSFSQRHAKLQRALVFISATLILMFGFMNCSGGFEVQSPSSEGLNPFANIEEPLSSDQDSDTSSPTLPTPTPSPSPTSSPSPSPSPVTPTPTPTPSGSPSPLPSSTPTPTPSPSPSPSPSAVPAVACGKAEHQFPIATHWSNSQVSFVEGANDQLAVFNPTGGVYKYNYNYLPTYERYIGTTYSSSFWPQSEATAWAQTLCNQTGIAIEFRRGTSFSNWAIAKRALADRRGSSQILMSLITSKSMVAVILPPGWSLNDPAGTYPIVVNGAYDLKGTTSTFGATLVRQQAQLWRQNKANFIGVIWNGGGDIGSRTVNEGMFQEINHILQLTAQNFGGDPQRIMTAGGSRGGVTSLRIAANPYNFPYKVRIAYAAVPPADLHLLSEMVHATTPVLLTAPEWSTGFTNCLDSQWKYPMGLNSMGGLNCRQTHLQVIAGTFDKATLDSQVSLTSDRLLNSLKAAGTQVYLEIGSHDFIVPWLDQMLFARKIAEKGIPHELRINYLAGHWSDANGIERLVQTATSKMGIRDYSNLISVNHKSYYRVDMASGQLRSTDGPKFTMEFPRAMIPRLGGEIIATGVSGTKIKFSGTHTNGSLWSLDGEINTQGFWRLDISKIDAGEYKVTKIQIQKPNENWKDITMQSRTTKYDAGAILILQLAEDVPAAGEALAMKLMEGILGPGLTYANGEFNAVNYGILED